MKTSGIRGAATALVTLIGSITVEAAEGASDAATPEPGTYVAVAPTRVASAVTVASLATVTVQISGRAGVPAGAAAVTMTTSATAGTTGGVLTVWPAGAARPGTTNLTTIANHRVSSQTTVALSSAGAVSVYNAATTSASIYLDVTGYYRGGSATAPGAFKATTNTRLLNAKSVAAGGSTTVQVGGQGGIPSGARAAILTLTATAGTSGGTLTAYPVGSSKPATANLTTNASQRISGQTLVRLGTGGAITVSNSATTAVSLTVDSVGFVIGGTAVAAGAVKPVTNARLLATTSIAASAGKTVQITGRAGVPAGTTTAFVTLEVTGTASGSIVTYPAGGTRSGVTSTYLLAGKQTATLASPQLSSSGAITVYNGTTAAASVSVDAVAYVVSPDVTPPGPVTLSPGGPVTTSTVELDWTDPTDSDYSGVTIRRAAGSTAPPTAVSGTAVHEAAPGELTYTDTGLAGATTYSYALFAHDSSGNYAPAATTTVTTNAPLSITTSTVPNATVNAPYSASITAVGGDGYDSWDVSTGTLPDGLSLDGGGTIAGYPTTAGTSTFTVRVTDVSGNVATHSYTIVVRTFAFVNANALPAAQQSVPYSVQLTTRYGTAPVTFAGIAGALPDGLTMSDSGLITGTATTVGNSNVTVQATDANFVQATKKFTLAVVVPSTPVITTKAVPGAQVGAPYLASLDAVGGTAPLTWSVGSGALPAGLTLSSKGVLSGSPTSTGTATFTAQVTDAAAHTSSASFTIAVTAISDWTQPGYNAEQQHSTSDTAISTTSAGSLHLDWSLPRGSGTVAVAGGILYAAGPVTTDSNEAENTLTAYHVDTGVPVWQVGLPGAGGDVSVTSTLVLVPCNGGLRSYSLTGSHALVWDTTRSDPDLSLVGYSVLSDRVVVTYYSQVSAYLLTTGARQWKQLIPTQTSAGQGIAASGTTAVVPMADRVKAFNTNTGAVVWTVTGAVSSAVISGSSVYTDLGGKLTTLALSTGATQRSTTTAFPVALVLGVDGGTVYVSLREETDGCPLFHVVAYSTSNGALRWTADVPSHPVGAVIANNLLWLSISSLSNYCDGNYGAVEVLSTGDGSLVRELESSDRRSGLPVVAEGRFVMPHATGLAVYGFAPPQPVIPPTIPRTAWVGTAYSTTLSATGGTARFSWSIASGTLPAGLTLGANGTISGTATAAADARVTVRVTDGRGLTASRTITVTARAAATGSWPTTNGDPARTGLASGETTVTLDSYPQLAEQWDSGALGYVVGDVAVTGGKAYVVNNDSDGSARLYAYDTTGTATGERSPAWQAATDASYAESGATVAAGKVFVLTSDALYAFDATTGARSWKAALSTQAVSGAPLVVGSKIYISGYDGAAFVQAFNVADGSAAWATMFRPRLDNGYDPTIFGALASDGSRIFAVGGCEISAIDPANGNRLWDRVLSVDATDASCNQVTTDSAPLTANGLVYVGSSMGLWALDTATGATVWSRYVYTVGGMALSNGVLLADMYFTADPSRIYAQVEAMDATTGDKLWATGGNTTPVGPGGISVTGDLVLLSTNDSRVTGLDLRDGTAVWQSDPVSNYATQSAVAAGHAYYLDVDDALHVYGLP